jgi:hypothetical protein
MGVLRLQHGRHDVCGVLKLVPAKLCRRFRVLVNPAILC